MGARVPTLKSVFGVIRALGPVLYCGGLLYYFLDASGSVREAWTIGLGPTVLGLGAVGILFSIPLILKIVRMFARPRSPGSGSGPDTPGDEGGFDVDGAIARYMAQRSVEAVPNAPAVRPAQDGGRPAGRPGFGRRVN